MTVESQLPGPGQRPTTTGIERARDVGTAVTGTQGSVFLADTIWYTGNRRERRGALALDLDHQRNLHEVFVPPPRWERATEIFADDGVVLLAGDDGIGRRTAGWQLLARAHDEHSRPIQVLKPEFGDGRVLHREDVVERDRLLLDLSDIDDQQFERVQEELPEFFETAAGLDAVLVVLLPAGTRRTRPEFRARFVELGAPDSLQMLRRHLSSYGIALPTPVPHAIDEVLKRGNVRDIADLAYLAREARAADPNGGVASWLGKALAAISDRDAEIAGLVRAHPTAAERALLLAMALFDDSDCETIAAAESQLLQSVPHTVGPGPEFERAGLGVRVNDVGGRISPDGRVHFKAAHHPAAVLRYFWTHFPSLRGDFVAWVVECGALRLEDDHRERMVARLLEQCFAVGRLDDVFGAVHRWATEVRFPSALASAALEYGLTNEEHGWAFRRKCYDWATAQSNGRTTTPARLADLVVAACRTVIVETHPEQAIVRLRHLTRHPHEQVAMRAVEALAEVVGSDRERMRYLLTRLTGGRAPGAEPRDAHLFLTIVAPESLVVRRGRNRSLLADAGVRSRLAERWHDVLDSLPSERYEPVLHRWLSVQAEAGPPDSHALVSVLVAACDSRFDLLSSLHAAARSWLRTLPREPQRSWGRRSVDGLYSAIGAAAAAAVDAVVAVPRPAEDAHGGQDE
jgi:hypothetical protein